MMAKKCKNPELFNYLRDQMSIKIFYHRISINSYIKIFSDREF